MEEPMETKEMLEKRRKIQEINQEDISQAEKTKKIQALYTAPILEQKKPGKYNSNYFYHNEEEGILGCKHYPRQAQIICPHEICKKSNNKFTCRLCHDEYITDHKIDRFKIEEMVCMHCGLQQDIAQNCIECKQKLGEYYCDVCHLFSDAEKDIFHCKDCGLCRVGKGLGIDFKHCNKCNSCININVFDTHKCTENGLKSDCPVCGEYMFTSTIDVCLLKCGHYMHKKCLNEYTFHDYKCPICKKSLGDMSHRWALYDEELITNPMPDEFKDKTQQILCYDCEESNEVPYHFILHKCPEENCGSYNTVLK